MRYSNRNFAEAGWGGGDQTQSGGAAAGVKIYILKNFIFYYNSMNSGTARLSAK
jgi:hypothetical protein